jgi:hypothetical protein
MECISAACISHKLQGRPRTLIYREGNPERIIHIIGQIQNLLRSLGIKDDD